MPTILYEPPISHILTGCLAAAAAGAAGAGARTMRAALGRGDALGLVRGIRILILGLVAGLAAVAFATGKTGFLVIGLLILAEELYETGMLATIIRLGERGVAS